MRLIPISITEKNGEFPLLAKASDFSTDHYDGIQVRKRRDGKPVLVMKSRNDAPLPWMVEYGFSQIYFRSFDEAIKFCSSRGMQLVKEQME